jgi:hypothetical protein
MNRKALLVAVNDYVPIGAGGPDLNGCVNDLVDMFHTLNALGIVPAKPGSMRILYDKTATRANILNGVKWLVQGAKKGDVLVFHYSGHGSQMADISGAEIDGKDETICPHDYQTAGMIKDDDLLEQFTGIEEGVVLEIILDSCHSGTGTRELAAMASVSNGNSIAYRYVEPPLEYGLYLNENPTIPLRGFLKPTKDTREVVTVPQLNHVLWASCRDYQTCAEADIDGKRRGIFTYCFCKAMRRAGMGVTRRKLDSLITADVKNLGYSQVLQLEGTERLIDAGVFT